MTHMTDEQTQIEVELLGLYFEKRDLKPLDVIRVCALTVITLSSVMVFERFTQKKIRRVKLVGGVMVGSGNTDK